MHTLLNLSVCKKLHYDCNIARIPRPVPLKLVWCELHPIGYVALCVFERGLQSKLDNRKNASWHIHHRLYFLIETDFLVIRKSVCCLLISQGQGSLNSAHSKIAMHYWLGCLCIDQCIENRCRYVSNESTFSHNDTLINEEHKWFEFHKENKVLLFGPMKGMTLN